MRKGAARLALACLLAVHTALLPGLIRTNFVTLDEAGHIPAGLHHWQTDTYGPYRVNPPLPRMLAALPLLMAAPAGTGTLTFDTLERRVEFSLARSFAEANRERYFDLVCLARLAGIGWSLLGAWVIYRWADELYGRMGGLLATALWCFGPNVLAHAALDTPDIPGTVAGVAATYVFWGYLRQPSWRGAILCGLLLGVAELTKFTMLALYAIWPCLFVIHRFGRSVSDEPNLRLRTQVGHGLVMVLLSLLVINCGYGFTGTGQRLGDLPFVSAAFRGQPTAQSWATELGNRFDGHWLGRIPLPVPADYLRGLDVQQRDFERIGALRGSYLSGEWRDRGWWYYYLYGLAVKVPLGTWGLVLLAFSVSWRLHKELRWTDELFLWLPALGFLALISSQTGFNHHLRYVFPLFPFVCVSTGKAAMLLRGPRWGCRLAVPLLLGWTLVSGLRVYPHLLSYFNEAAGGPENGHAHLIDSNIDWGQDLLELRRWLDQHPEARPLGVVCWKPIDPGLIGIEGTSVPTGSPDFEEDTPSARLAAGPHPGYYAISVNALRGDTPAKPGVPRGSLAHGYEYFREFQPIARAGYSIYIYHITLAEAQRVRQLLGLPPLEQETLGSDRNGAPEK